MPIGRDRHRQRCTTRGRTSSRTRPAALYGGCGRRYETWANHGSCWRPIQSRKPSVRNVDAESSAGRSCSQCQRGDRIGEVVAEAVAATAATATASRSCRARGRSRAAPLRTSTAADRRDRRRGAGRRLDRCSRTARARSRRAGQRGRRCRSGCRAACRWRRPGCSSGTCRCTARRGPASTARPGVVPGEANALAAPGRRGQVSAPRDGRRTTGSRHGTGRA